MAQVDVYKFLKERRLSGDNNYFTVKEVEAGLRERGHTNGVLAGVRGDLTRLAVAGFLDTVNARGLLDWPGRFRLKRKYLRKR